IVRDNIANNNNRRNVARDISPEDTACSSPKLPGLLDELIEADDLLVDIRPELLVPARLDALINLPLLDNVDVLPPLSPAILPYSGSGLCLLLNL
ncbi:hypothetical protein FRACYDRAFT_219403, partial [Fragilariopsis cylindrus CCMP1102]